MEYKVGDLIKIIGNSNYHGFKIGEVVRIIDLGKTSYKAEFLDGHYTYFVRECDIVLVNGSRSVLVDLERYIIKEDACIVFWKDGSKTVVKKMADAEHNKELAFLTAYFQKHSGLSKTKANKFLSDLEETKQPKKKIK